MKGEKRNAKDMGRKGDWAIGKLGNWAIEAKGERGGW
jgi:hypothetical protein